MEGLNVCTPVFHRTDTIVNVILRMQSRRIVRELPAFNRVCFGLHAEKGNKSGVQGIRIAHPPPKSILHIDSY
jgi:hypothetical protein